MPRFRARARSSPSRSRWRCGPRRSSASTRDWRWAGRRPRSRTRRSRPSSIGCARGSRASTPWIAPRPTGDLVVIDYSGTVDGEPFEGSEATDLMVELGAEGLLPEFDRALAGAAAGDEVTVEVRFRRRPPAREPGGQAGELRGHREGGPGEEAPRARRRVRRRGVGVRDARRASRRAPPADRRRAREPDRGGVPRGRRRRRRRRGADRAAQGADPRPRPRDVGAARALAGRAGRQRRGLPSDAGQDARAGGHRPGARRRAGAAPRGDPGGGRRGRGDRRLGRGAAGGAPAGGGGGDPGAAAGAPSGQWPRRAASRGASAAQGGRGDRRLGDGRSRRSRPRPASSSGRPRRRRRRAASPASGPRARIARRQAGGRARFYRLLAR